MSSLIELFNVSKDFGKTRVLSNIDLRICSGSVYGLIGPNGAGKTTLMKVMSGLLPFKGKLTHEGDKSISFFPQVPDRLHHIFVSELLDLISTFSVVRNKKTIDMVLELLSINELLQKKVNELSTGQKKRVLIAMTCLHQRKVIIFDEPLNGMDPLMVKNFQKIINILKVDTTLIISSHQLLEMDKFCDEIILLHQGKVLEQGSVSNLKQKVSAHTEIQIKSSFVSEDVLEKFENRNITFSELSSSGDDYEYLIQLQSTEVKVNDIISDLVKNDINISQLKSGTQNLDQVFDHYYGS